MLGLLTTELNTAAMPKLPAPVAQPHRIGIRSSRSNVSDSAELWEMNVRTCN